MAALYVVLHHVYLQLMSSAYVGSWGMVNRLLGIMRPLAFGHYAVDLFIVLSGYCLMLPVIRSHGQLRGGVTGYITRRAKRILPPYYAALIFSALLMPLLHYWDKSIDVPSAGNLVAHVFLIHNLVTAWAHTIDPPMWSVATEWQIYFVFPFLLLPLWQKMGIVPTVIGGFAIGMAVHWLLPGRLDTAAPWFIGMFVLGMAGATINFPAKSDAAMKTRTAPWGTLGLVLMCGLVIVGTKVRGWFLLHPWFVDPIFGLAAMCLIVYCVQVGMSCTPAQYPALLKVFNSRWAIGLGVFSYSLYLTHYPLLSLLAVIIDCAHMQPSLQLAVACGIFLPLALAFAYGFYLLFERPFMNGQTRTTRNVIAAPNISPTA